MASTSAPADTSAATAAPSRRTMDAPTRVLHWLMALSFAGAYLTSEMDGWRLLHISFGFTMAGAVAARLVWGLIGPRPARLSSWVARIRPLLKGAGRGSSAGSTQPSWNMAVVLGIVLGSVLVVASGITMNQGWGGEALGEAMEELHEVAGNAVLVLVLAHLSLLAWGVLLHGGAQVMAMITGRRPGAGASLVPHNRTWLGVALVAAAAAFWWGQWAAPNAPWLPVGADHAEDGHGDAQEHGDELGDELDANAGARDDRNEEDEDDDD